jgi:hypothetical protein
MILPMAGLVLLLLLVPETKSDDYDLYEIMFNQTVNCFVYFFNTLICRKFNSWTTALELINSSVSLSSIFQINVKPDKPLVLTSDFDIRKPFVKPAFPPGFISVVTYGLTGVDVVNWPAPKQAYPVYLTIIDSHMAFYTGDLDQYNCSESNLGRNSAATTTLFNYFTQVVLQDKVFYDGVLSACPYLFINSHLDVLFIGCLIDSPLVTNLFNFQTIKSGVNRNNEQKVRENRTKTKVK